MHHGNEHQRQRFAQGPTAMHATSEATLLLKPFASDADDLVTAFDDVRGPLLKALNSMLGSREDAEDAMQMAFIRCWQARAALPQIRNLRAWVWRIALNVGRDLLDYTRRRRTKPLTHVESTAFCRDASCIDVLALKEDEDRLNAALQRLRPEEKEVFLLRQNMSPTYGEIARSRSMPVGSVKTLMHGAVQKLRCLLTEKSELLN